MSEPVRTLALPSWLVTTCAALVVAALVAFVVTGDRDADVSAGAQPTVTTPPAPDDPPSRRQPDADKERERSQRDKPQRDEPQRDEPPRDRARPPAERRTAYVEVYNNSGVTGLAGQSAAVLQDTGWRVVATDNWYGEIPSNTVYYPEQLRGQARQLARDLGVDRLHVAVAPMSFDRLTVILTGTP